MFINNLGYIKGGKPVEKVDKKRSKCLIDVMLLLRSLSQEERNTIFGKVYNLCVSDIFYLHIYDIFTLLIIHMKNV